MLNISNTFFQNQIMISRIQCLSNINDPGSKLSKSNILVILLLFGSSGRAGSIETPLWFVGEGGGGSRVGHAKNDSSGSNDCYFAFRKKVFFRVLRKKKLFDLLHVVIVDASRWVDVVLMFNFDFWLRCLKHLN